MHLAILAQPDSWYYRDLERAARDRRHACARIEYRQLAGGVFASQETLGEPGASATGVSRASEEKTPVAHAPGSPDAIVVRTMPPASLEQVVLRMDLLGRWEARGVRVVNPPKALECAIDKYLTTARLAAAGLPVPDTIACETADLALEAFAQLGGDVVVKPLFGGEGRGIVRVSDPDIAQRVFHTLERIDAVLYLQQYIDHGGSDVRVLVLDGHVLGGMRRHCREGFRTNVSQMGRAEPHAPTERERELALQAAAVTGTVFAGVDILYDREGRSYVIEVNAVPGWRAFAHVNQMDVADVFVRWLQTAV
jgi:ribosomal protein S6--L-glutamate ligase